LCSLRIGSPLRYGVSVSWRRVVVIALVVLLAACTRAGEPGNNPPSPVPPPVTATTARPAAPETTPETAPETAPTRPIPTVVLPEKYDPSRNAAADVAAVLAQSARDHREILLDFGADWCPDCVVLHRLLATAAVQQVLRQRYHLVSIDVGQFDHNLDVAGRYVNLDDAGIPALVVLAPTGAVRFASDDGSFANARTMTAGQVRAFLVRWAG
jgi:thiol-disulfide isomerase/thioredoxin